ncbi:type II secretion system F family protein [Demequina sp.]|uniref:type II secretion system F family protein n=1 Tax=Demequina sp. TaxID=2050685 RepID=UPI0025C1F418|nr:type II secretion system F family protein [Demequina sp.]
MTAPTSLVAVVALMGAAVRSGLDVRSALEQVGRACGGDAEALCAVAAALGTGAPWDDAWGTAPARLEVLARALAPAWHQGSSPVSALTSCADSLLDKASAAGEGAAAELGVRIALPLALCLMPAFVLTGVVPLLIALAGAVMSDSGGVAP